MNLRIIRPSATKLMVCHSRPALPVVVPIKLAPSTDADEFARIKHFDAGVAIEIDTKKMEAVKDGGRTVDWLNVGLKGYLSTFKETTESDRDGDYVERGAFTETIKKFMAKNPVLLTDHRNSVSMLAGNFTKMSEDKSGLHFEAILSNAPDVISTRFKVAEGLLKTTSMGGIFHFKEDGRGIFKVDLWEGSLTPLPANPDALFSVRAVTDEEKKFIKSPGRWPTFYHFRLEMADAKTLRD